MLQNNYQNLRNNYPELINVLGRNVQEVVGNIKENENTTYVIHVEHKQLGKLLVKHCKNENQCLILHVRYPMLACSKNWEHLISSIENKPIVVNGEEHVIKGKLILINTESHNFFTDWYRTLHMRVVQTTNI